MTSQRRWWEWQGDRLILRLHVQPRAARSEVRGLHGGRLKVRVRAAPSDGAANAEVCHFLALEFRVPKSDVELLTGSASREKSIVITAPKVLPLWFTTLVP